MIIVLLFSVALQLGSIGFSAAMSGMEDAVDNAVTDVLGDEVDAMKAIKKIELHLHLGGAWPLDYLREIATPEQYEKLVAFLERFKGGMDYHECFQIFSLVGKIVDTDQKVEDGVVALCRALSADNVAYAEFRTGLKDLGSGLEGYLQAVLRGIERAQVPLKVGILLSLRRDSSAGLAGQTVELVKKYRHHGVVGIDLSGDSVQGDGEAVFESLVQARECDIPVALHLGESPKESAEQQMKELQKINPSRIGHGVHLCQDAIDWIRERRTPVELCLRSAVLVGMIKDAAQHPALQLLRDGHPVIICTDDPLIFDTTLSQECAAVARLCELTVEDVARLQKQAKHYAFGQKI